jgi:hypothetical protein
MAWRRRYRERKRQQAAWLVMAKAAASMQRRGWRQRNSVMTMAKPKAYLALISG